MGVSAPAWSVLNPGKILPEGRLSRARIHRNRNARSAAVMGVRCNVGAVPASLSFRTLRAQTSDEWRPLDRKGEARAHGPERKSAGRPTPAPIMARMKGPTEQPVGPSNGSPAGDSTDALRLLPGVRGADRKVEAGQELFGVGAPFDGVHNLIDGWVALYTLLEDGRRQIVQFVLPGGVFGMFGASSGRTTYGAQALTEVLVCVIPQAVLSANLRDTPDVAARLVRSLSRDRALAFDHLTSVGRRNARERIACLILELFVRCRTQWPGNRIEEMYLPLTQEHIGDATGLTFVHVNRVLRTLRKEGVVEFHHRRLRILDPDRLVGVAGVDHNAAMAWL
ncbi:Crp/Fnr family transcriptional regulator [Alteraurantiacibacter palmitatis]|uniref:Crp/Fnr family transcriptional regulator n=1 Tax=Alteraurantiacibacter palmitatis TaxID=2054628 RepID=A0ABV7E9Q3_9SPHN